MRFRPWHVCVLIPARNEERPLARCLRSVMAARLRLPPAVTCDVIVAVDSSTDSTWDVAQSMMSRCGAVVCTEVGVVGLARALAAQTALQRYVGSATRCWLANTDADCIVPDTWLTEQVCLADRVEAVAGIVDVDTFDEHDAGVRRRFQETYLIRQDGSHSHVHGANLGVRADAYLKAGGWGDCTTGEDHDLWQRLGRTEVTRMSTNRLSVLTSGRRTGRAHHGFAEALSAHNESAA
jgi:glycosyltransferase involved in cell wall biosynthesis